MLKNYLKIAFRAMRKQAGYTVINITGLAIGLMCCFVILFYVRHELTYDSFHEEHDRIYRVLNASRQDASNRSAVTAAGYAPHLMEDIAEVEQATRVWPNRTMSFKYASRDGIRVSNVAYADENFFEVFDFSLERGRAETALDRPGKMLVTREGAQTLFGQEDPVGKTVTFFEGDNQVDIEITGIVEEPPTNSHLQFDYLVSFQTLLLTRGNDALEDYVDFNYQTYVKLRAGTTPDQFFARVPAFLEKRRGPSAAENQALQLQPISEIHLADDIGFDPYGQGNRQYLYIFSAIALFILLIACINFMNLSTARATQRAKEVGIRKSIGAVKSQLIKQFYGESFLSVAIALLLAIGLTVLITPLFTSLLGREIAIHWGNVLGLFAMMVLAGALTGLAVGSYPAIVLSSFEPVTVLKGLATRGRKGIMLRKSLIVIQFGISVMLIVAAATVYLQVHYMKSRALGFDKEFVLFTDVSGEVKERFDTFRQRLMQNGNIQQVSLMGNLPGRVNTSRGYNWPGREPGDDEAGRSFYTMLVDPYSLDALDLELEAGRFFDPTNPVDAENRYVINETAARLIGWDNPVDQPFRAWDDEQGTVIGVVKDFHFQSLHQDIQPVVLDIKQAWSWNAVLRVTGNDLQGTLAFLEQEWRTIEAVQPLRYRFLDEDFDRLYRAEEELGSLFSVFTGLALFIACLGLLGLVSYAAERRRKEIGVRKVLGASNSNIFFLMAKEFGILVGIAFLFTAPIAYVFMREWLLDFAYKISLNPLIFIFAGLSVLVVALLTVSYQSLKAAFSNPIESLRYE